MTLRAMLAALALLSGCTAYSYTHVHEELREGPVASIDCTVQVFAQLGSAESTTYRDQGGLVESQDSNVATTSISEPCAGSSGGRLSTAGQQTTQTVISTLAGAAAGAITGGIVP